MNSAVWLSVGRLALRESLVLSVLVSVLLIGLACWVRWSTLNSVQGPPPLVEAVFVAMRDAVAEVVPQDQVAGVLPFVGTLWLVIVISNLLGLVPGLSSPAGDLSVTGALAVTVFVAVHWYGVRASGWKAYLRHYLAPNPILLPFHVIGEITRTIALAIRLFGNIMSLELAALLVLLVAGFLVPVPLLLLHVVEALVQAYIFGILALIYIGSALEIGREHAKPENAERSAFSGTAAQS